MAFNFHEDLKRADTKRGSSDRNFGFVFACFFTLVGAWPLRTGAPLRIPALAIAAAFATVALIRPALLHRLYAAWAMLGLLLGRIVNPVVTAILFFAIFTPVAVVSRLRGKDSLRLKPGQEADTWWISRQPPGPLPDSMSKQF